MEAVGFIQPQRLFVDLPEPEKECQRQNRQQCCSLNGPALANA
jgi:hypothetical protein